jgi:hypothetical protein
VDEIVAEKRTMAKKRKRYDVGPVEKERAEAHDGDADPEEDATGGMKIFVSLVHYPLTIHFSQETFLFLWFRNKVDLTIRACAYR